MYDYNTNIVLTANANPGSTFIGWTGGGCSGTGTCTVTMSAAQSVTATFYLNNPADDISNPNLISSIPYQDISSTNNATQSINDPALTACSLPAGQASVWYHYSPTTSREVSFDTYGSNYDTVLAVWSGSPGSLSSVACNDNAGGAQQSMLTITASPGTTYYIEVAQYPGTSPNGGGLVFHATTFADTPGNAWYWTYVEGFYAKGITTGCATNPFQYCPDRAVTRAEMAVFILRAIHGGSYQPTPNPTGMFSDVPVTGKEWMEPWIEEFYNEGMTTGCYTPPLQYCPERSVTRAEMAVFILRAIHGSSYQPPAASHYFSDDPVSGKEWMEAWVDEFYRENLTTGCAQNPLRYCPEQNVTRAEMATFIDRAFNFPTLP